MARPARKQFRVEPPQGGMRKGAFERIFALPGLVSRK